MYITIEGPIGVGKTSLTKLIQKNLDYLDVYEIVEENPFLEKFYQNQEKWAFQTEMFFLVNRYNQLLELQKKIKNKNIVSDYHIMKNLIFAQKTLNTNEFSKFKKIYNVLTENICTSDLIIILDADLEVLKERIKKRNRSFETDIPDEYLNYLIQSYRNNDFFIDPNSNTKTLVLDVSNLDFVNNDNDKEKILEIIQKKIKEI